MWQDPWFLQFIIKLITKVYEGLLKVYWKFIEGLFKVSRLYKKCSTDGDLTIFLPKRELKMDGETGQIGNLEGIVIISENLVNKDEVNVFIQVRTQVETFESVTSALASYRFTGNSTNYAFTCTSSSSLTSSLLTQWVLCNKFKLAPFADGSIPFDARFNL